MQLRELIITDTHLRQLTKTRIHAVDFLATGNHVINQFIRLRNAHLRVFADGHIEWLLPGGPERRQRDELIVNLQFHDGLPVSTIGRFSPFSRAQSIAMS